MPVEHFREVSRLAGYPGLVGSRGGMASAPMQPRSHPPLPPAFSPGLPSSTSPLLASYTPVHKMSVLCTSARVSFLNVSHYFLQSSWAPYRQDYGFSFLFSPDSSLFNMESLLRVRQCALCWGHNGDWEGHRPVSRPNLDASLVLRRSDTFALDLV